MHWIIILLSYRVYIRQDAFRHKKIFLKSRTFLEELTNEEPTSQEWMTHFSNSKQKGNLRGCPEKALKSCLAAYIRILKNMEESLVTRFESVSSNPLLVSMANFLDAHHYQFNKQEDFYDGISAIIKTFKPLLKTNECML